MMISKPTINCCMVHSNSWVKWKLKNSRWSMCSFCWPEDDAEWLAYWNPGLFYPINPFFCTGMECHICGDNKPKTYPVYRSSEFPGSKHAVWWWLQWKASGRWIACTLHATRIYMLTYIATNITLSNATFKKVKLKLFVQAQQFQLWVPVLWSGANLPKILRGSI